MRRLRLSASLCLALLCCGVQLFAQNRDPGPSDLSGIPKSHHYFWATAGGTVLGLGVGIIAPGGAKSAWKGALIGGSATSAFYLAKYKRAGGRNRPWAHVITNTALGAGIFWTACNCDTGFWGGALIGGGGTAIIQGLKSHHFEPLTTQNTPPDQPVNSQSESGSATSAQANGSGSQNGVQTKTQDGTETNNKEARKEPAQPVGKKPPQPWQ